MLLLLLALAGGFSISSALFASRDYAHQPGETATLGPPDRSNPDLPPMKLGNFEMLPGTSMLYAQLRTEAAPMRSFSSGLDAGDVRNLLFFDTRSRESYWLFRHNARYIASISVIERPDASQASQAKRLALGLLFLTHSVSREGKGTWDIHLAAADGRSMATLASGVDSLLDHTLIDDRTLLVFYARQGTAHVLDVDPSTRDVRSDRIMAPAD